MTKKEKIVSVELEDENTVKTVKEIYEPRYEGFWEYDATEGEWVKDTFKEDNKVWCTHSREGFQVLDTGEKWAPDGESVEKDIESFQKYLDDTYGKDKYEAYALGAYIHSAVSFAFNKGEDTRCRWDSGTCGFVGINKKLNVDLKFYAGILSDAWNGCVERMWVYDNYEDEPVDEITSLFDSKMIQEWKEKMEKEYGIKEYKNHNDF